MTYVNIGSVTAIGVIFPILATIAMTLRGQAWRLYSKTVQVDDVLIIPSFVSLAFALIYIAMRIIY